MRGRLLLIALALAAPLSGCAALSGFPADAVSPGIEAAELANYTGPDAIARYEACEDKVRCRNAIIDARLRAVDLQFFRFIRRVYAQEAGVSFGADVLAMGLDAVAAVSGAAHGFAAGASALTGGRDAYERQVLSVSMPLLFEQMTVNRREVLLRIRQAEATPVASYSLFQALSDVTEYEMAGSLPAAAAELQANAGTAGRALQARLDAQRAATVAASTPVATTQVAAVPVSAPAPPAASTTAPATSPSPPSG